MPKNAPKLPLARKRRFWTEEKLRTLNEALEVGKSYSVIAKKLGITEIACRKAASDNKLPGRYTRRSIRDTNALKSEVIKLHGQGLRDIDIANKLSISRTYVLHIRRKLGIPSNYRWGGQVGSNGPRYKGTNPK